MPENRTPSSPTFRGGTVLTASQHEEMAKLIEAHAGKPGGPPRKRAAEMARNHRVLAQALRQRGPRS